MKLNILSIVRKLFSLMKPIFLVALIFIGSSANAAGWLINWELGAFAEYSDNVNLSETNEDDAVFLEPRGRISATHLGPNFDADIAATNEYRSRLSGDQGSSNNFDLDGSLNWKISPGLFEWTFEDHFNSELPVDIRSSPNESNKQDVNTFTTGPTFTPRIFNQTNLIFEGRYIRTDAEETETDSDRYQGRVGIQRQLNSSSNVSLNYQYEDTDFDENTLDPLAGNVDFDRSDYFIAYQLERPSLTITAQAGYSEIERDEGPNQKSNGNNSRLGLNYILNSTSSLNLSVFDEFSDSTSNSNLSGGLGGFNSIGGGGLTGGPLSTSGNTQEDVTGDTVDSEGIVVGFNKQFSRVGTNFQYFYREDDHDLVDLNDRESNGGIVSFVLPITSYANIGLLGEIRTTDYDLGDREDDDTLIELSGEYLARKNLIFESSVDYRERDSNVSDSDFDEIRVRIGVRYTNF